MMGRALAMILIVATALLSIVACTPADDDAPAHVDYAGTVKLDMSSETVKENVTVKSYIDGDTTHFYISESVVSGGVLKARYLAINTPESTGKIEEWGKAASNFTKETLKKASSIIVESDNAKWNLDSTGDRHLVWVWYKTEDMTDYRNLNIEILQNGLAIVSNSANNRYGEICMAAINQAKNESLHVHSNDKDPNFPYGQAVELTLKELRTNIEEYDGMKVAFEGVVCENSNNTAYLEDYDEETGRYYGMTVYYGYALNGSGLQVLNVGNRARIVGSVQYYETGGTYQVSGLQYSVMKPNDPNNIKLVSEGHSPAYTTLDINAFKDGTLDIIVGEEKKTFKYAELAMSTSVEIKDVTVKSLYTTTDEQSSSKGAITITGEIDGKHISIRTIVLRDQDGQIVTEDYFKGKIIDVKGIVDYFDGTYQIKVYSLNDIIIH